MALSPIIPPPCSARTYAQGLQGSRPDRRSRPAAPRFPSCWPVLACLLAGILRCTPPSPPPPAPPAAFYSWKKSLDFPTPLRRHLDAMDCRKIYVKFFDVDHPPGSSSPVPLAVVQPGPDWRPDALEVVPVVFLTNRTFRARTSEQIDTLAWLTIRKLIDSWHRLGLHRPDSTSRITAWPREFQFDCDWTDETGPAFFRFLQVCRTASLPYGKPLLSATIRLHQFRDPDRTGVPPVDKGMLMAYNVGNVEKWETPDAILDTTLSAAYLTPQKGSRLHPGNAVTHYPLPLDVALPLFRWGAVYRDGQLLRLFNNLSTHDLSDLTRFRTIEPLRYEVVRPTFLFGTFLQPPDLIRIDTVSRTDLLSLARQLSAAKGMPPAPDGLLVSFFALDSVSCTAYPPDFLDSVRFLSQPPPR